MKYFILILSLLCYPLSFANPDHGQFEPGSTFQVCFTPFQACNQLILQLINRAQHSIKMQAYGLSNCAVVRALVAAKKRGVDIMVLLDKTSLLSNYNFILYDLTEAGIPFLIDYQTGVAHNKLIIVDDKYVETGSFNFYEDIERKNAENMLIIKSKKLLPHYIHNFDKLKDISKNYTVLDKQQQQTKTCLSAKH